MERSGSSLNRPSKTQEILNLPVSKIIVKLAIPSIISLTITQLYQLTDTYFVSSLGVGQTAAIAINNTLEQLIMMIGTFFCVGSSSYISRLLGAGRKETANKTLSFAFTSGVILGFLFMITGLLFLPSIIRFLGGTQEIQLHCEEYARFILYAAPFTISSIVINKALCVEGQALYAMVGMGSSAIVNVILDPILIFGCGLGIAGASIATAISKVVAFVLLIIPFFKNKSSLKIRFAIFKPSKDIVSEIAKMGSPSLFRVLMQNTSAIIMNNLAGLFSTSVLAGIATSNRILIFISSVILGMGQGLQPVIGQNWGARKYQRVKDSYKFATKFGVVAMIALGIVLFVFAKQVMNIFVHGADAEMLRIGVLKLRAQSIMLPIEAACVFANMSYTSSGKAAGAFVLSLSRQGICLIPALLILPSFFGANGLAVSQPFADFLSMIIALPLIIKWLKKVNYLIQNPMVKDM